MRPSRVILIPKGKYPILIISGIKESYPSTSEAEGGSYLSRYCTHTHLKASQLSCEDMHAGTLTLLGVLQVPQVRGLHQGKAS